jgi:hypothetical protein
MREDTMFSDDRSGNGEERSSCSRAWYWVIGCGCTCLMISVFAVFVGVMFWYHSTPREK